MVAPVTAIAKAAAYAGKEQYENKQQKAKPPAAASNTIQPQHRATSSQAATGGRIYFLLHAPFFIFFRAVFCLQPSLEERVAICERDLCTTDIGDAFKERVKKLARARIVIPVGKVWFQILVGQLMDSPGAQFEV